MSKLRILSPKLSLQSWISRIVDFTSFQIAAMISICHPQKTLHHSIPYTASIHIYLTYHIRIFRSEQKMGYSNISQSRIERQKTRKKKSFETFMMLEADVHKSRRICLCTGAVWLVYRDTARSRRQQIKLRKRN